MVISMIGVYGLVIGALAYSFAGTSLSVWELIGVFIVVIAVLAWFVCLSILDKETSEEELETLHLRLVRCEDRVKETEVDDNDSVVRLRKILNRTDKSNQWKVIEVKLMLEKNNGQV